MDTILSFLTQSFEFIIPLVLLLGALIFVHELGHFLVAKYYGVKVETFSLGFGKKILQFTKGETTYCLSIIPFGGYVKMFGDDPNADIPESEKNRSFLHKPVGQRIAVVLAGPLMNLFFAFFLFMVIAGIGDKKSKSVVGQVVVGSLAEEVGFEAGDVIQEVNGVPVEAWSQVDELLEVGPEEVEFKVYKEFLQDSRIYKISKTLKKNPNILSWKENIYAIDGLEVYPISTQIGVLESDTPANKAGLKTGDLITSINGVKVKRWYELKKEYGSITRNNKNLLITIERLSGKEKITKEIEIKNAPHNFMQSGIERADLYVGYISPDSPASKAGVKIGDKILKLNKKELRSWSDLTNTITSYKKENGPLVASILRGKQHIQIDLIPEEMELKNQLTGKMESSFKIGVGPVLSMAPPETVNVKAKGITGLLSTATSETIEWVNSTALGFIRLIQNKVSAKSIGGPIMIGQIASESYKLGLNAFLKIMAIISINLFLLNLLPVPVLDGGHLVFFTIEAIKGSPLSMKKLEKAQQLGLFLLLFLMVFAMFNDISRVFGIAW